MKTGKLNMVMIFLRAAVLLSLWVSVFFVHGISGSAAWALAKLVFAPLGVIMVLVDAVLLVRCIIKRKKCSGRIVSLVFSALIAFPLLFLLNVIPFKYPISLNETGPAVTVSWPLKENTIVGWGGDNIKVNAPHVIWASERWAYDLLMVPANVGSNNLNDYGIFNKEVIAPASGTVIAAYDDENDIPPNTEDFLSMEGNHVYIKLDSTGTFLLLNHLKKDSVQVKVGDHVEEGEILGKVGNSGSTSEPHLHIHHQRQNPTTTIYPIFAEGLPLYFKEINGKSMPEKGAIIYP